MDQQDNQMTVYLVKLNIDGSWSIIEGGSSGRVSHMAKPVKPEPVKPEPIWYFVKLRRLNFDGDQF